LNLREENGHRDGKAIVDESYCVSSNLANKEEVIQQVDFAKK
jgi:hypothetical protein